MTSNLQVRMFVLSREVGYLLWICMNSAKSRKRQAIPKLSLAYRFRKMIFMDQNLKTIYMNFSFDKFLIFFWLILVDTSCLMFDFSRHQRNTARKYIPRRKHIFCWCKVKDSVSKSFNFPRFHEHISNPIKIE